MENHGVRHGAGLDFPGVEDQAERAMTVVGALVLQLRREAGYSIGSLAAAAGLSPGLLSQIERGQETRR